MPFGASRFTVSRNGWLPSWAPLNTPKGDEVSGSGKKGKEPQKGSKKSTEKPAMTKRERKAAIKDADQKIKDAMKIMDRFPRGSPSDTLAEDIFYKNIDRRAKLERGENPDS